MRLALSFAVLMIGTVPGWASDRPPAALYHQWVRVNEDCRGGAGDEPSTMTACEYRNVIDRKMAVAGWCYGQTKQNGGMMDWYRCKR